MWQDHPSSYSRRTSRELFRRTAVRSTRRQDRSYPAGYRTFALENRPGKRQSRPRSRSKRGLFQRRRLLRELDLYEYRDGFPSQLSGGQKRKLGLARALAVDPMVLLMDEPLVSLDEFTREELQNKILTLWQERDLTMVTVTHDMEEVSFLGQNIAVLSQIPATLKCLIENHGAGNVEFRGSEEFYRTVQKTRRELP